MQTTFRPTWLRMAGLLFLGGVTRIPVQVRATEPVASAETAVARFSAVCDKEIKQVVSPDTRTLINHQRVSSSLTVVHRTSGFFIDPYAQKAFAGPFLSTLYGSHKAVINSSSDIWVLSYTSGQEGLAVYLDAISGTVLCIDFIPEG